METKERSKKIGIWNLVAVIYIPIILFSLFKIVPKIKLNLTYESQKTKFDLHHKESKKFGYPGIPYIANTGTSTFIYVREDDVAYGECGWNFYCVPEELNAKKGLHYLPINPAVKRIRENVVRLDNTYFCNSFNINGPGKCTSRGWRYGSER